MGLDNAAVFVISVPAILQVVSGDLMPQSRHSMTFRLDAWELVLLAAIVIVVVNAAWRMVVSHNPVPDNPVQSVREMAFFREKYGPDHFSEREEEWMIRDYFQDRRGGVFVDVGANHYKEYSKTYYLESMLGWSGLAIEPQREFAGGYAEHRRMTKFFPFFVSDVSDSTARLYMLKHNSTVASSSEEFVKRFTPTGQPDEVRDVPTITLTNLWDSEGIRQIDFLNMDIELHEPQALKGFDIGRFKPSLVCVEGLLPVRQQILDYFARNGYVFVGMYMWVDQENLYFAPLKSQVGEGTLP
jgi:FkbM family methyltransferase